MCINNATQRQKGRAGADADGQTGRNNERTLYLLKCGKIDDCVSVLSEL